MALQNNQATATQQINKNMYKATHKTEFRYHQRGAIAVSSKPCCVNHCRKGFVTNTSKVTYTEWRNNTSKHLHVFGVWGRRPWRCVAPFTERRKQFEKHHLENGKSLELGKLEWSRRFHFLDLNISYTDGLGHLNNAYGIVVTITVFCFLVVAFYAFFSPFLGGHIWEYALIAAYSPVALLVFVRCTAINPADPGIISIVATNSIKKDQLETERSDNPVVSSSRTSSCCTIGGIAKFCTLCNSKVCKFSKHCRSCDKCVDGFDHHCWLVIEAGVGIIVLVRCFVNKKNMEAEIVDRLGNGFSRAPICNGCAVSFLACVPLSELFFFHMILIRKEASLGHVGSGEGQHHKGQGGVIIEISAFHLEVAPQIEPGTIPSTVDPDVARLGVKVNKGPKRAVKISAWKLAKLDSNEAMRAAAKARASTRSVNSLSSPKSPLPQVHNLGHLNAGIVPEKARVSRDAFPDNAHQLSHSYSEFDEKIMQRPNSVSDPASSLLRDVKRTSVEPRASEARTSPSSQVELLSSNAATASNDKTQSDKLMYSTGESIFFGGPLLRGPTNDGFENERGLGSRDVHERLPFDLPRESRFKRDVASNLQLYVFVPTTFSKSLPAPDIYAKLMNAKHVSSIQTRLSDMCFVKLFSVNIWCG
ncbi:hypothetical protein H5410_059618 [Solanum commersonii]|uniref:Protein S-acyltransferase n=1 Tax=Solanum commersonii TaxID=4109 RepID=A0A9J5W3J0_SOLCO|nr:hypothetical protein H5410_059618 [Solanum commersonii]